MDKRWLIKKPANEQVVARLIEEVGVSGPIARIMAQRGITDFNSAKEFFRPNLHHLHDPFKMKGMSEAVDRIERAIAARENILIYGDYDVDGTTAVTLVFQYLTREYEQVGYYIPDRYKEGYGVSDAGVDFAIDNSFSLVIALDCGTKEIEKIARAKENGIDFIVCDHHTPANELPDAILLNPKQPLCKYPFKELSGCGIGFKLVQALNSIRGGNGEDITNLLDLVVVSIAADIVSMSDENRVLAFHGLEELNKKQRPGFKKLLELAGKNDVVNITDVVFILAPRINAAGRIASGNQAVELLLAKTFDEVDNVSKEIHLHNETRKGLDREITLEALAQIEQDEFLQTASSTVVYHPDWHKGVVGIVASRLTEVYYRPTIVLTQSNGRAVGSARSIRGFNIYDAIEACDDLLDQFGGHSFAAGLSLPVEHVDLFRKKFDQIVVATLDKKLLKPVIEIDAEIDFRDIYESQPGGIPKFYRVLNQMAPFGPDNMRPVFITRNVRLLDNSRILKEEHLKLRLQQDEYPEIILDAVGFGLAAKWSEIEGKKVDLVYTLEENSWNGKSELQLLIRDIKKSG
ncbi:MAG: single-stranded-DNA-specific exonuclease RecJ [Crocinitomicaceae bacterium]|nr:single-stranded-DNA-specific exonuclease RecJ [Crocinitomicaceae bacterium]